jgi:asparagine synthase (glutamine-hydrolysing)
MCGILGVVSTSTIQNRNWLNDARDLLSHRGPDDYGSWWSNDGKVGLGHRRLSILDLSTSAKQPMLSRESDICISFNGEIYNYLEIKSQLINLGHTFLTTSDTEVVIYAYKEWGIDFIQKMVGMFAIAIHDIKNNLFFLLRDRAGEKPLFYCFSEQKLYFSSETKAILKNNDVKRSFNVDSLNYLLSYGYSPTEHSIIEGIDKVPPGCILKFNLLNGEIEINRYWDIANFNLNNSNTKKLNYSELIEELDTLLTNSIKLQLHADVSVGVLLSGGLDSSLVTAIAAQNSKKIKTFNVTFPDFPDFDESKHARLVANHYETDHYELTASKIEPEMLIQLAEQFDDPIIDSSMLPTYLVSKLVKKHCTVALGGDGGDELFGGYKTYSNYLNLNNSISKYPTYLRYPFAKVLKSIIPKSNKLRYWAEKLDDGGNLHYPTVPHFFKNYERKRLLPNIKNKTENSMYIRKNQIPFANAIEEIAMRMDFNNYMPNDILVKVDRASMLASLELRAPILDHRIIEFAFSKIPNSHKVNHLNRKIILKNLSKKYLPDSFDFQRKKGFSIPINYWIKNEKSWRDFSFDILICQNSFFDKNEVEKLLNSKQNNGEKIYGLLMIQLFQNKYNLKIN